MLKGQFDSVVFKTNILLSHFRKWQIMRHKLNLKCNSCNFSNLGIHNHACACLCVGLGEKEGG